MPYIKIETNQQVSDVVRQELLKKTSDFIAGMLGKPERYVMVSLQLPTAMIFAGETEPTAFVELKSIGLPREACPGYAQHIADFLQAELSVPPDRAYIEFSAIDGPLFGWNGGTF